MSTSTYIKVCAGSAAVWALGLLVVPPFSTSFK